MTMTVSHHLDIQHIIIISSVIITSSLFAIYGNHYLLVLPLHAQNGGRGVTSPATSPSPSNPHPASQHHHHPSLSHSLYAMVVLVVAFQRARVLIL
jgi:hypothetical protein